MLAGVLAFSPGARSAFLEIFRLKGATVERVDSLPEVEVQTIDFGERVSLEEAELRVGFELVDVGEPDAVFVRGTRMASLVYGSVEKPRLVLSQIRGAVWDGFVKKVGSAGTRIENVTVAGERGLFITATSTSSCSWTRTSTSRTSPPTSRTGPALESRRPCCCGSRAT